MMSRTDIRRASPPRLCPQVNDNANANVAGSPGELLSRRCVNLMKTALRPDMWPRAELKLQWFDKLLMTVVSRRGRVRSVSSVFTGDSLTSASAYSPLFHAHTRTGPVPVRNVFVFYDLTQ